MKKFELTYFESYSKTYTIEAENRDEAEQKLFDEMARGHIEGPTECYDSGISSWEEITE